MTVKKDEEGNIVTDPEKIRQLYSEVFTKRLEHKNVNEDLKHLWSLRMEFFQMRLEESKMNKSEIGLLKILKMSLRS